MNSPKEYGENTITIKLDENFLKVVAVQKSMLNVYKNTVEKAIL
jgi:hypothetical protein